MRKTYLVTGGLGFLGAALVRRLVQKGHAVRVLDNSSRGSEEKLGDAAADVEIHEADIRDRKAVISSSRGVDSIIHLAYVNGTEFFYRYPAYVLDVGVKGMVNVLDACLKEEVPELVLVSSSEVYQTPSKIPTDESVPLSIPDPKNPRYSYGGGKIISELMALNFGREHVDRVVVVRPHNVYGPAMGFEHVIPQFVGRLEELVDAGVRDPIPFPIQGDGSQTRAFIYVDDFTDGLMLAVEGGEHLGIYHIGTMEEISIADVAVKVADAMGRKVALRSGREAEGGTLRRCPDNGKITALGFTQKISLDEGIAKTVAWYRERGAPAPWEMDTSPYLS